MPFKQLKRKEEEHYQENHWEEYFMEIQINIVGEEEMKQY